MKITKLTAPKIVRHLSPMAIRILKTVYINKETLYVGDQMGEYCNGLVELIALGILRAEINIIDNKPITVLTKGGSQIIKLIKD